MKKINRMKKIGLGLQTRITGRHKNKAFVEPNISFFMGTTRKIAMVEKVRTIAFDSNHFLESGRNLTLR